VLIGVGSQRRSASQTIDLPSDGGVNLERLFTLKHGRGMQANGDSLRSIAFVWMSEFGLGRYDAKTVQRILSREDIYGALAARSTDRAV
jgi:hypothetical protein